MNEFKFLHWTVDGRVATVTMDNPPVNAVTGEMYEEIRRFFGDVGRYVPEARAIVLTGAGRHFCGGSDLSGFKTLTPDNAPTRMKLVREAFWSIYDSPVPVIAAVHGVAVGTGLAIAASCDLVIAAEGARFGLPEVGVGMMGGAKHASRLVPQALVRYLHLTAEMMPAEEVADTGVCCRWCRPRSCSTRRPRSPGRSPGTVRWHYGSPNRASTRSNTATSRAATSTSRDCPGSCRPMPTPRKPSTRSSSVVNPSTREPDPPHTTGELHGEQ